LAVREAGAWKHKIRYIGCRRGKGEKGKNFREKKPRSNQLQLHAQNVRRGKTHGHVTMERVLAKNKRNDSASIELRNNSVDGERVNRWRKSSDDVEVEEKSKLLKKKGLKGGKPHPPRTRRNEIAGPLNCKTKKPLS